MFYKEKQNRKSKKDLPKKDKKVCNSFFLYRRSVQDQIKAEYNVKNQLQVNRIAGQLWKQMSLEERQPFVMEAYKKRLEKVEAKDVASKIP
jgi:hypothetical protein